MSPTLDACLRSWPWDPWLTTTCVVSAAIYWRGWRRLKRHGGQRWQAWQPVAFVGGVLAVFVALASPIEPLAALLLQVHMIQHLLLIMVAPPLIWLGAPMLPLVCGIPKLIRNSWAIPVLRSPTIRQFARQLTHPAVALTLFVATNVLWHVPASYELALRSSAWHYLQHACFLGAGLLFWFPVIRPYPSRPSWSAWLLLPYLILADIQNTLLSAWLTFSGKVLYPYYEQVPRIGNNSPLDDQAIAGAIMWVPGSVAFLGPLAALGLRLLFGTDTALKGPSAERPKRPAMHTYGPQGVALYSLPVLDAKDFQTRPAFLSPSATRSPSQFAVRAFSTFFRWRYSRMTLQSVLLLLAVIVIYDGLSGPQASPLNLAGVLPWIHWRGLLILGLLAIGNVSCMVCPFTLPRRLASRFLPQGRHWPRYLRSKWLAVVLVALFLWTYEAFALWDSPWWTACIAVGYFAAAFTIDGIFRGAAFCKYVCPIGQFNFVQSLVSPVEIAVRDHQVCMTCRTADCIRGRDGIPGCELDLFQPRKSGNMDCTFCLNCVQACPVANVGMVVTVPGSQLWHDRFRSGVGRLGNRSDVAALVLVLVFGSFANAAGMVRPVVEWEQQVQVALGISSPRAIVTLFYVLALVVAPLAAVGVASKMSCLWTRSSLSWVAQATRYSFALVPLGFGMWLAHYSFHFFTSYDTVIPTTQRFANDLGLAGLGTPSWGCACCAHVGTWLIRTELMFLASGFLLSLYTAYRIAVVDYRQFRQVFGALLPWAVLTLLLYMVGVWLVFQPMQMRGTTLIGG